MTICLYDDGLEATVFLFDIISHPLGYTLLYSSMENGICGKRRRKEYAEDIDQRIMDDDLIWGLNKNEDCELSYRDEIFL
jgi:hypothetical protein